MRRKESALFVLALPLFFFLSNCVGREKEEEIIIPNDTVLFMAFQKIIYDNLSDQNLITQLMPIYKKQSILILHFHQRREILMHQVQASIIDQKATTADFMSHFEKWNNLRYEYFNQAYTLEKEKRVLLDQSTYEKILKKEKRVMEEYFSFSSEISS